MKYERRIVPGYLGLQADTKGRIWRGKRELKGYVNKHGYVGMCLREGIVDRHRLVCLAFHGEPPTPKHEAAHWNDIPGDDRPNNLRWATRLENRADAIRNGRLSHGESHYAARLTADDVRVIRSEYATGLWKQYELASRFGVDQQHISDIVRCKTWRHIPDVAERARPLRARRSNRNPTSRKGR